jgi:hypothetical protein
MESEANPLECAQNIEKLLESEDIENDFYSNNGSPNDDLESEF